ncbi:hypothetical protein FSARC_11653 [Fusarium sarcochroum]|uniref:Uncharacterized protein n=1 Tax=Fusarium sarcochroum TaxID=1208366 RepID=A0A8H4X082_9HYPO|nr:hypothetical protein FSARC_11653 [Fusarium sarcochroum]
MHLTPQVTLSLLTVLWAIINNAGAVKQPKAVWQTQCWDVKTTWAKTQDCSGAFDLLEGRMKRGEVESGPYDGCKEIVRKAERTYLWAQTDDGGTGGTTALEGFEQFGEEHTYAEVHLATSTLTNHNNPDYNQPEKAKRYAKYNNVEKWRALVRRDEEWVRHTQFVVRDQWANRDSATDGDLTRQQQSDLTSRLRTDWISDNGHTTRRRSAIGRISDSNRHTWTLAFHSAALNTLNSSPIVDREPIISSFFTLLLDDAGSLK